MARWRVDSFQPAPPTGIWLYDTEREIKRRLAIYHAAARDRRLQRWLWLRCKQDFWFWHDNFAWTHDPTRPLGRVPMAPWDCQRALFGLFLGLGAEDRLDVETMGGLVEVNDERLRRMAAEGDELAAAILRRRAHRGAHTGARGELRDVLVEKSREMGASVVMCEAAAYEWLFYGGHQVFISLKREKVDDNTENFDRSLFGKIRCIVRWCPEWMRPSTWRSSKRARFHDRHMVLTNPDNGGAITGQSTDPDAVRGERAKRCYIDEANSIPWLEELMTAIHRVGPAALVSSVKGMGTHFARLTHGRVARVLEHGAHVGRPGWVKVRLHYSQRPDRDPTTAAGRAWVAATRPSYTPEGWAQEMEIDYASSQPGRIWGEHFSPARHVLSPARWRELQPALTGARLIEGWDFGSGPALTAVVWALHVEANDTLYLLDYRQFHAATDAQVEREVAAAGYRTRSNPGGRLPDLRVGDIAGSIGAVRMHGGRKVNPVGSWIANLRDRGIEIHGRQLRVEDAISRVDQALRDGRLLLAPRCAQARGELPSLVETFEQYSRETRAGADDPTTFKGDTPKPRKDIYSHAADAVQHIAWEVWPRVSGGMQRITHRV